MVRISEAMATDVSWGNRDEASSQNFKIPPSEATTSARLDAITEEINEALAAEEVLNVPAETVSTQDPAEASYTIKKIPKPES